MIIIGADFHPAYQEIASVDTDTGEYQEKRLTHPKEAEEFYGSLASVGEAVREGREASGHGRWFERLLEELRVELWMGDAEVIRAKRGRKQKTDREDARHWLFTFACAINDEQQNEKHAAYQFFRIGMNEENTFQY